MSDTDRLLIDLDREVVVLAATRADCSTVVAIYEEVAHWLHRRGIPQWAPGRWPESEVLASIERGEVYLAWSGSTPLGSLSLLWSDPEVWGNQSPDAGYIHKLMIRRAWAGRGLGRWLLRWAERHVASQGRHYLRLDCWSGNRRLIDYYRAAGFAHRGDFVSPWHLSRWEKAV